MPSSAWSSDVCSSDRSEEHTSELQSPDHLVCRLLLEKKKHTSELRSPDHLPCPLLIHKTNSVPSPFRSHATDTMSHHFTSVLHITHPNRTIYYSPTSD